MMPRTDRNVKYRLRYNPRRCLMPYDTIFSQLVFRNLTGKNRVRSNISGRFDNDDGTRAQARINWEVTSQTLQ
jgi:hypothetical protein